MENVSEALLMAGEILVFIVALTVCISSFNTLRTEIDSIISQTETVSMAKTSTSGKSVYANYINSENADATRVVGVETVATSMYRSVKEDYTLYLIIDENDIETVQKRCARYTGSDKYTVESIALEAGEEIEIGGRKFSSLTMLKIKVGSNQEVNKILSNNDDPQYGGGLYNIIKGYRFYEYLGEYQEATDASSVERTTYRIITYIEEELYKTGTPV